MTLHELNILPRQELIEVLNTCCGSRAWISRMLPFFPAEDLVELLEDAEEQWFLCTEEDWKEAFAQHPRIGDIEALQKKFSPSAGWEAAEQSGINNAPSPVLEALADHNQQYEKKFGYIFIICATGMRAADMLTLLQMRLQNSPEVEIEIAADEQNKITKLRIEKLLE